MIKRDKRKTVYYCDRCGMDFATEKAKEKPDTSDLSVSRGTYFMFPIVASGKLRFEPKHFCGDCTVSLYGWFRRA